MSHIKPQSSKDIVYDEQTFQSVIDKYKGVYLTKSHIKKLRTYLEMTETELKQKENTFDTLPEGNQKQDLLTIIRQDKAYIKAIKEVVIKTDFKVITDLKPKNTVMTPNTSVTTHYNVQEVIRRMSKPQFNIRVFNELRKDKSKAIEYLLSCGVYWQRSDNANIDWMRAVMSVNALSKNY